MTDKDAVVVGSLWSIGLIRSALTVRRGAPRQGIGGCARCLARRAPVGWRRTFPPRRRRPDHRHYVAAPGTTGCPSGPSTIEPEQSPDGRLRDAVPGQAESAWAASGSRARNRRDQPANRADRSHRWNASRGHQARVVDGFFSRFRPGASFRGPRSHGLRRLRAREVVGFSKPVGDGRLDLIAMRDWMMCAILDFDALIDAPHLRRLHRPAQEDADLQEALLRPHEEVARRPREHDRVVRGVDPLLAEGGSGLAQPLPGVPQVFGQIAVSAASVVVQQSCASPSSTHCLQ